jgi:signal transduction histidine kinase
MTILTACDNLGDGMVIIDEDRTIRYMNQTARRLTGAPVAGPGQKSLCRTILRCGSLEEPNRLCAECRVSLALRSGRPTTPYEAAIGQPGQRVWVESTCTPLPEPQPATVVVLRQRTAEVADAGKPEAALSAQSHAVLQSLTRVARDLLKADYAALGRLDIYRLEMRWLAQDGSQSPATAVSSTPLGRGIRGRVVSTGQPVCINRFPEEAPDLPEHHPTMQSEHLQAALAVPVMLNGEPNGVLMVAKREPAAYGPEETQLLRSLSGLAAEVIRHTDWVVGAQAAAVRAEREWLAAELHDGLAQLMAAVSQRLRLVCWVLSHRQDLSHLPADLHDILELSEQAHKELRLALGELRAPLEKGDFFDALHSTLSTFSQRSSLRVELVEVPEKRPAIPPLISLQVLRIIQEALANARKHSGGSHIWVRWTYADQQHTFSIKDDGHGFDLEHTGQGFGRTIMSDRARRIGGQLKVYSAPESGCAVILTVPDGIEGVWAGETDPSAAG